MVKLREYQIRAIETLRTILRSGKKRPVLVLPTGAGKSVIFGQMIANILNNGKTVLWIVHRRNLVIQMQSVLKDHFGIEAGIIMSGIESDTDQPVQLCTIQTFIRRMDLSIFDVNRFRIDADIVLIDEGHRSIAKSYSKVIEYYKDRIIIACTATPMRADGRGLGEVYDSIADIVGIKELTKDGYLVEARYFVPGHINLQGVKTAMGDYVIKDLDGKVNTTKLIGDIVQNWLKLAENRKTIVYAVNVKHSKALRDEFVKNGVAAEHLDAHSTDEERDDVFKRMANGELRVICNVALYQEGLDVPDVSCIVMARPTKSMGLYRQCLGRGLRPSPGQNDCLMLDHGNVIEEHGLLDWDIIWSLDGKKRAWSKPKKKEVDKLKKCRVCHLIFTEGNICPDCGTELKSFGKKIRTVEAELEELDKKKIKEYTEADKRRWYGMLLWQCRKKGYSEGWVSHKYKERFKVWPRGLKNTVPIELDDEFKNWIRYQNIKWAKSKNNPKAQKGLNRGKELAEGYHAGL